jgi:hypothetical protein
MSISFSGAELRFGSGASQIFEWPIREAAEGIDKILVLLDPDVYLIDPTYKQNRSKGAPALRNLIALDNQGRTVWKAEMPEAADYYYRFVSVSPLVVDSFSSYRCEIDILSGRIVRKQFFK